VKIDWSPIPNCDVADLNPGDLVNWENRALRVVSVREVPPVDWQPDEQPGQQRAFGALISDERPPAVLHLDDGTAKGLHLRIGFRPKWRRNVQRLKQHHPVCGDCGQLWPCNDERIDREVAVAVQEMQRLCQHCGKTGGGMQMFGGPNLDVPGQMGAWFHSRTKRRAKCADAADDYQRRRAEQRRLIAEAEAAARGES
jgi:hypothetical protein